MNNNNHNEEPEIITDVVKDFSDDLLTSTSSSDTDPGDNTIATYVQSSAAILTHVHTKVEIEIATNLSVIHIGKPNDRIPPDIDISGFPDSQIVSRVHADIVKEGDHYYIEDTGSANGTYINHTPLPIGNRHKLKTGDRIAFGKEDKVSFIFTLNY